MIILTRLDRSQFYVNVDLIETVEMKPDTVISLTNGKKLVVRESAEEVVQRLGARRREVARQADAE